MKHRRLIADLRAMMKDCAVMRFDTEAWDVHNESNWEVFCDILDRAINAIEAQEQPTTEE